MKKQFKNAIHLTSKVNLALILASINSEEITEVLINKLEKQNNITGIKNHQAIGVMLNAIALSKNKKMASEYLKEKIKPNSWDFVENWPVFKEVDSLKERLAARALISVAMTGEVTKEFIIKQAEQQIDENNYIPGALVNSIFNLWLKSTRSDQEILVYLRGKHPLGLYGEWMNTEDGEYWGGWLNKISYNK